MIATTSSTTVTHHGLGEHLGNQKNHEGTIRCLATYIGVQGRHNLQSLSLEQHMNLNNFLSESEARTIDQYNEKKRNNSDWLALIEKYKVTREKTHFLINYINKAPNIIIADNSLCKKVGTHDDVTIIHRMTIEKTNTKAMAMLTAKDADLKIDSTSTTIKVEAISQRSWNRLLEFNAHPSDKPISASTPLLQPNSQDDCCCNIQ